MLQYSIRYFIFVHSFQFNFCFCCSCFMVHIFYFYFPSSVFLRKIELRKLRILKSIENTNWIRRKREKEKGRRKNFLPFCEINIHHRHYLNFNILNIFTFRPYKSFTDRSFNKFDFFLAYQQKVFLILFVLNRRIG